MNLSKLCWSGWVGFLRTTSNVKKWRLHGCTDCRCLKSWTHGLQWKVPFFWNQLRNGFACDDTGYLRSPLECFSDTLCIVNVFDSFDFSLIYITKNLVDDGEGLESSTRKIWGFVAFQVLWKIQSIDNLRYNSPPFNLVQHKNYSSK